VNTDIILISNFMESARRVAGLKERFLMTGQRWDMDLNEPLNFSTDWEERLRSSVKSRGKIHTPTGMDYFVFPRGIWEDIPPLAIGRYIWDSWLIYDACVRGIPVVDATGVITAVHQNHNFSNTSQTSDLWEGAEARLNFKLAGGWKNHFTVYDATHRLTEEGLKPRPAIARVWPQVILRRSLALSEFLSGISVFRPLIGVARSSVRLLWQAWYAIKRPKP
jgi:hypothetical protein